MLANASVVSGLGAVLINADQTLSFTPNQGYVGDAKIAYTVMDGLSATAEGLLTVAVSGEVFGDENDNILAGSSGNDTITAGGGNDVLNIGTGNDYLLGGAGDDLLNAAEPLDTILSNNAFLPYSSSQNTASQLAEAVFSANSGINIISASYSGADQAVSFFSSFSYGKFCTCTQRS